MSTSIFQITEHVIPCQYIREYPDAVKSERKLPQLAIKEYKPLDNLDPSPGDVTIIAAHGNGLPKENYEPLWDDLYLATKARVRAIWFADCSHQGASGVLNEDLQGDDPNWFDHSRDLLCMVNRFWDRMPRPIIGIAHSMGSAQLVQLSLMHPRLIHGLALIEPVIQHDPPPGVNAALFASYRPDEWPSWSQAEASFRKNPFFKTWDPRALDKYLRFGLREVPTALYPSPVDSTKREHGAVTLKTSKHQEAWTYVRSNFDPQPTRAKDPNQQLIAPDVNPLDGGTYLFHRAEPVIALQGLPYVRPSILWLFGGNSKINTPASRRQKTTISGTAVGGSGGVQAGQVEAATVEGATHMLPFEKIHECATLLARWLEKQIEGFQAQEDFLRKHCSRKSDRDMLVVSDPWLKGVRQKADAKRPLMGKL